MILFLVIAVLVCLLIIMIIKLHMIRQSIREIKNGFRDHLTVETNTLIDVSSRDKEICQLAEAINEDLEKMREQRLKYQQGDRELKEAVTNISHDLRTPLTAIYGYLDLLHSEEKSPKAENYLRLIENRTETLKDLTQELFRYSVITSVNDDTSEMVLVNKVLEDSLLSFYGEMTKKNIVPEIEITSKQVKRELNRFALLRVFENIISNGLKYSDGDFKVVLEEDGTILFINGAKDLSTVEVGKLFDRFFTVESGRGSTGLGLSIAKLLTERMGGSISAEYKNGQLWIKIKL